MRNLITKVAVAGVFFIGGTRADCQHPHQDTAGLMGSLAAASGAEKEWIEGGRIDHRAG